MFFLAVLVALGGRASDSLLSVEQLVAIGHEMALRRPGTRR